MFVSVVLAFIAAFLFAGSAALQRRAALVVTAERSPPRAAPRGLSLALPLLPLIRRLVRKPLWLIGWLTNLFGFLCQAVALHFGSVALVQPLLVTQLLFALPMASASTRRWPPSRDWLAGLAICGGVALLLSVEGATPLDGDPDRSRLILACLAAAAVVAALVLLAERRRSLQHSVLIALAAGLCYATSAALMKLTTADLLYRGVAATALDWPGYALAVSTLCGLLLGQEAYASGSLPAAIAAMSISNPAASYAVGLLAFHAAIPIEPSVLAAVSGAGLLLFAGAFGLAHSPTVWQETVGATQVRANLGDATVSDTDVHHGVRRATPHPQE